MHAHASSNGSTQRGRKPLPSHSPHSRRGMASAERERESSRKERSRDGSPKTMTADEDG